MINYDYEECKQIWKKGAKWSNRAGLLWKSAHETDGGAVFFKIWKGQGVLFSYILFSLAKRLNKKYAFYVILFKNGSYQTEERKIRNTPGFAGGISYVFVFPSEIYSQFDLFLRFVVS